MTSDKAITSKGFQTLSGLRKVLVAPLNWGLGHATRCIPIIRALSENGFTPIVASDGDALTLLKKEFSGLTFYELPGYNIRYSTGSNQAFSILLQSIKVINAINAEQKTVAKIHKKEKLSGIISDNRFGVRLAEIPSVYMTHQINVLSGATTDISSKLHQQIIKKFDVCWVPDYRSKFKLSGRLSKTDRSSLNIKFIGALSRFNEKKLPKKYKVLIILSGPEPQRSLLEDKLLVAFKDYDEKVFLVRGVFSGKNIFTSNNSVEIVDHLLSSGLEDAINSSEVVLSRSGYSTILDLAKLHKKAFFIPTPGQFEQEYLAKHLQQFNVAPFATQDDFTVDKLEQVKDYKGFSRFGSPSISAELFDIF